MEILSTDEAPDLVTNLEVMNILSKQASPNSRKKRRGKVEHVDWIQQHVSEYLSKTPCAHVQRDRMPTLVERLKGDFGLTDAETLQILNFMPRESVEIHLIIEDLPSRLAEERQEELLTLIGSYITDDTEKTEDAKLPADEEILGEVLDEIPKEHSIVENGDGGEAMLDEKAWIKAEPT